MTRMYSPILLIWVLLSVLVAGTCTFSFLQPFWFMHSDYTHSFGLISYCHGDTRYQETREVCGAYGGNFNLARIPSGAWQAACVLYGGGCLLLCMGAFVALCVTCIPSHYRRRTTKVAGYTQTVSVLIMVAGLFIFPLGLGSNFVRRYCGQEVAAYVSGNCIIGWSYMLGIMGTALAMFCPFLSNFTDMKASDIFS